jgi:hypothetical protein
MEYFMKITKRQLRRIIKEEKQKLLNERGTGNPALQSEEQALRIAVANFADAYMLTMGTDPSDPRDMERVQNAVDNMVTSVMGVL